MIQSKDWSSKENNPKSNPKSRVCECTIAMNRGPLLAPMDMLISVIAMIIPTRKQIFKYNK